MKWMLFAEGERGGGGGRRKGKWEAKEGKKNEEEERKRKREITCERKRDTIHDKIKIITLRRKTRMKRMVVARGERGTGSHPYPHPHTRHLPHPILPPLSIPS